MTLPTTPTTLAKVRRQFPRLIVETEGRDDTGYDAVVYSDRASLNDGQAMARFPLVHWRVVAEDRERLILAEEARFSTNDAKRLAAQYRKEYSGAHVWTQKATP